VYVPNRILPCAQHAGKQKYQKRIAPMEDMIVVSNILVEIHSIIAVEDVKEKTLLTLLDRSGNPLRKTELLFSNVVNTKIKMFLILLLLVCVASSSSIATCKNGELILNKQEKAIQIEYGRLREMKCICVNDKFPFTKNTCSVPPVSDFKKIYMCDQNEKQWIFQQNECLPLNNRPFIIAMFFAFIIWLIMRFIC